MKKFIFLYYGYKEPTADIHEAWSQWFASIGDKLIDGGNPFGVGRDVNHAGTTDLPHDENAITGYSIINADSLDEAEKIASTCPFMSGIYVYEAMPM